MEPTVQPDQPPLELRRHDSRLRLKEKVAITLLDQDKVLDEKGCKEKTSRPTFLTRLSSRFQVPSWLFSAVIHGIAMAILAQLTFSNPVFDSLLEVESYAFDKVTEPLAEIEFDMQSLLNKESMESSLLTDTLVPDLSKMSESLQSQIDGSNNFELSYDMLGEFSRLYGSEGNAMAEVGDGIGEVRGKFYGTRVRGRMAIIFDITGSMFDSVPLVLEVLDDPQFANAQVYAVFGGSFKYPQQEVRVISYRENLNLHYVEVNNTLGQRKLRDKIYQQLISRKNTLSFEIPKDKKSRQSLGVAIDAILRESRTPNAIFVFSDFEDGVDQQYMQELVPRIKKKRVNIIFYHPEKFKKDRNIYNKFAEACGGEVKENLLKQ